METMQELFYRDPYAREFSATITSCREGKKGFEVVLDDTAFYPEGGGQPSDEGTLGEAKVTFVKRVGPEIVHYIDKPLEVGSTVIGKIDWERRFDNMQNHTCEHIFSGLVHQKYKFENVGHVFRSKHSDRSREPSQFSRRREVLFYCGIPLPGEPLRLETQS